MSILEEIKNERARQDAMWGHEIDDTKNTPWMWAAYIAQYATKWMVGSFTPFERTTVDGFRTCMVKVAAIAVAAIESLDRQRAKGGAFYEKEAVNG